MYLFNMTGATSDAGITHPSKVICTICQKINDYLLTQDIIQLMTLNEVDTRIY